MTLSTRSLVLLILIAASGMVAVWAYWRTLQDVAEQWIADPQYSHGFLVPVFASYLLWSRRLELNGVGFTARWWGVAIVLLACVLRLLGHYFYQPWLDTGSLLVALAGLAGAVGGRKAVIWAAPAILFLGFMIPLPHRVQSLLGESLQAVATRLSTFSLQLLGVPAVAEGNVILLTNTRIGVVEACNGLSMLMTFFALSAGVAILVQRHWIERVMLVASAAPIAVLANGVRITVTGVLLESQHGELARVVFHDLAGWLMMPLAIGMLVIELRVMSRIVVPAMGVPGRSAPPTRVLSSLPAQVRHR